MKKPALYPIRNERGSACVVVHEILDQGYELEFAWGRAKQRAQAHATGWARNMTLLALRLKGPVDAWLAQQLRNPLGEKQLMVQTILRLGVLQLVIQKDAPHAVVNEMVDLTKGWGFTSLSGLVNAVLKKAAALPREALLDVPDAVYAPDWWAEAGVSLEGFPACLQSGKPPLDVSMKNPSDGWVQMLGGERMSGNTVRLHDYDEVTQIEGFPTGAWWVQDFAATLPVQMLGDVTGKHVLDLCAAPGGKTAQLCAAGAHVVALDRSEKRLKRLRENMERLEYSPEIIVADALEWQPEAPFDAILLDAPCSATGTLRRNPDVLWNRSQTSVQELVELQQKLFAQAAKWLAPAGVLVYAVCSLMPAEGEAQLAQFKNTQGLDFSPLSEQDGVPHAYANAQGALRTHPAMLAEKGRLDGFFAARFTKTP